jgi:hypothetical protein
VDDATTLDSVTGNPLGGATQTAALNTIHSEATLHSIHPESTTLHSHAAGSSGTSVGTGDADSGITGDGGGDQSCSKRAL